MSNDAYDNYAIVDDQSPRIFYSDNWFNFPGVDGAFNNTLSFANKSGSSALFQFHGNRVAVQGPVLFTKEQGPPVAGFILDGEGSPSLFSPPDSLNNTNTTFFLSPLLADGDHTLNVTLLSDGVDFFVDAILYNMTKGATVTATGGSSNLNAQATITKTLILQPTGVSGATQNGSSVPVGPIVGGVVGGITLLVCSFLAIYFLYWKPTRSKANYSYHATHLDDDWDSSDTKPLFLGTGRTPSRQSTASTVTPYSFPHAPSVRSLSVHSTTTHSDVPAEQNVTEASAALVSSPPPTERGAPSDYEPSVYFLDDAASLHRTSTAGSTTVLALAPTQPLRLGGARQSKAAEAAQYAAKNRDSRPVQQHHDSGYRFSDAAGPSSQPLQGDEHELPDELPPVYSES